MKRKAIAVIIPLILVLGFAGSLLAFRYLTSVEDLPGVEYRWVLFGSCTPDHPWGYWNPGKICYTLLMPETKRHENCHEEKDREGLTREQNARACGDPEGTF